MLSLFMQILGRVCSRHTLTYPTGKFFDFFLLQIYLRLIYLFMHQFFTPLCIILLQVLGKSPQSGRWQIKINKLKYYGSNHFMVLCYLMWLGVLVAQYSVAQFLYRANSFFLLLQTPELAKIITDNAFQSPHVSRGRCRE